MQFFHSFDLKKRGEGLSCDYGTVMHGLSVKSFKLSLTIQLWYMYKI